MSSQRSGSGLPPANDLLPTPQWSGLVWAVEPQPMRDTRSSGVRDPFQYRMDRPWRPRFTAAALSSLSVQRSLSLWTCPDSVDGLTMVD